MGGLLSSNRYVYQITHGGVMMWPANGYCHDKGTAVKQFTTDGGPTSNGRVQLWQVDTQGAAGHVDISRTL